MIIIATTRAGKEDVVLRDLEDALFPFDIEVKASKTNVQGLILLETSLRFKEVLRILSWRRIRHLYRLIPLQFVAEDLNGLVDELAKLLNKLKGKSIKVVLEIRGCKKNEVSQFILTSLPKLPHEKDFNVIIYVEKIDNILGLGVLTREEYDFIREKVRSPI